MNAYLIIDTDGPDDADRWLVFAESPEAALAHLELPAYDAGNCTVEPCPKGDEYARDQTERWTVDSPSILLACDIVPVDWSQCYSCDAWGDHEHEGNYGLLCESCWLDWLRYEDE